VSDNNKQLKSNVILMVALTAVVLIFGGLTWYFHNAGVKSAISNSESKVMDLANATKNELGDKLKEVQTSLVEDKESLSGLISSTAATSNSNVTATHRAVDGVATQIKDINTRIDALMQKLDAISKKLDDMVEEESWEFIEEDIE
jgi:peptidoglycan hydrolase CwlO-like protein